MTKTPIHLEDRTANEGRLFSPTAARNSAPIAEAFLPFVPDGARVLEIASGTGEHSVYMCQQRADLTWQTSDPDAKSRASQDAWADIHNKTRGDTDANSAPQILPSLDLNVLDDGWADNLAPFQAMFCANMIHIAPAATVAALASGAARILAKDQVLGLYGPFLEGDKTAPSNLEFDANLRARNPQWGVRKLDSVKHIFADVGFNCAAHLEMPKENRLIIFKKIS